MKKITISVLAVVAMILLLAGCAVKADIIPDEDILMAETRSAVSKSSAKQDVSATVTLYQLYDVYDEAGNLIEDRVIDEPKGNSNHTKVLEEHLYTLDQFIGGYPLGSVDSEWNMVAGTQVSMTNKTNYNLDPVTYDLWGSNHSVIDFVNAEGATVLTLQANGTLKGNLLAGADIEMNWVVKHSLGSKVKGTGKITGTFQWYYLDDISTVLDPVEYGTLDYALTSDELAGLNLIPRGTFTMEGTIREK